MDWLHMVAAGIWVGGLIQLLVGLPAALRVLNAYARRVALGRAVRRFSLVAALSVFVIVLTGTFSSTLHVPAWEAMAETFYGAALTTKLLLVAPLVLIGAINLLVLHPRFVRAWRSAAPGGPASATDDAAGRRWFGRLVGAEVVLAVLVLFATGTLSGLPPATSAPGVGKPVTETVRAGDLSVTLSVDPNQAGTNTFQVNVAGAQGQPAQVARVTLMLSHVDMDMGVREVELVGVGGGRYEAVGGYATMAGRWQMQVRVRRAAAPAPDADATASFTIAVGQPAGASRPLVSPARALAMAWSPAFWMALVVLAMAAFTAWLLVSGFARVRAGQRRLLGATAVVLAVAGVAVAGREVYAGYTASVAVATPLTNPFPGSPESIARGQAIFNTSCVVCHGPQGRGDGPLARTLRPPPADLRTHIEAGHTDAQLYGFISDGVPGTAMPAWKEQLTAEQIWDLVNYVKTFGGSGTPGTAATR
jgi:copper transport protein